MSEPVVDADPLIGTVVGGRYEVVRQIGRGGMGAIYEVRNTRLGRSFALKTLTRDGAASREVVARFRREADVIARIHHPNIVEIVDWEQLADGSPAIVMEYLHGEDLAARIDAGPMAWPDLARVADEILAALAAAHANGVVHRDLKPHNVYLVRDDSGGERVKLLDFGVSKVREPSSFVTSGERLLGTPSYMAPEQAEGHGDQIGPHTDVWAMGALLYELATGRTAFVGQSVPSTLYKVCHRAPAPLLDARADAPPAFVEVVSDALRKDPTERVADAAQLRRRLRAALADVPGVRYAEMPPAEGPIRAERTLSPMASVIASRDASLQKSRARRRTWLPAALITGAIAAASIVVAIVFATRAPVKSRPVAAPAITMPASEMPAPPVRPIATNVEPPPAPPVTTPVAAPASRKAEAPIAKTPPAPTTTPPITPTPASTAPGRKPCAKDDVECLYGDGT